MDRMGDTRLLELLIETWQGLAVRARQRATTANEEELPPADYWFGIAFTFEMAATQLLTALVEMVADPETGELADPERVMDMIVPSEAKDLTELAKQSAIATDALLNRRAQKLLDVLRASPEQWFKRTDIAHGLGNKTLSSSDSVLLQFLAKNGYIEMSSVETYAPSGHRYQYRAINKL
jgi:hypothetical protein